jgi:hypothetical protein
VFTEVEKLYYGVQKGGRKRAVRASRAARRAGRKAMDAAEAATRRPVVPR